LEADAMVILPVKKKKKKKEEEHINIIIRSFVEHA